MNNTLANYISNPVDPIYNFDLACYYDDIDQTSAAISFYLRSAERTTDDLLQYKCLLYISNCFKKQKDRETTVVNILLKAIALIPTRQEAYLLLCEAYERDKKWTDCYTMANIAIDLAAKEPINKIECEQYMFIFMKAISGYWIGKFEESKQLLFELSLNDNINIIYKKAVENNINSIGYPKVFNYNSRLVDRFKYKFKNLNKVNTNYSETFQDMFVLSILDGKENGTYLEFGCNHYQKCNNTFLLETVFNWKGLSIDIDSDLIKLFNKNRKNPAICQNILEDKILLNQYFDNSHIDYLQIDCDPPEVSFEILKSIPFDTYTFSVITFEHDYYYNKEIKDLSREFLKEKGYILLVPDVCCFKTDLTYEDWWIHPNYIEDFRRFFSNDVYNEITKYFLT